MELKTRKYNTPYGKQDHPVKICSNGELKPLGWFAEPEESHDAHLKMINTKVKWLLMHLDTFIKQMMNDCKVVYELVNHNGLLYKGDDVSQILPHLEYYADLFEIEEPQFEFQITINCYKEKGNDIDLWGTVLDYCIWGEHWLAEGETEEDIVWIYSLGDFHKAFEVELTEFDFHKFNSDVIMELNRDYELTYGKSLIL